MSEGKTCTKCGTVKPWSDFYKNGRRKDGRSVWCKPCNKSYSQEYNQRPHVKSKNAEKSLARYHELSTDTKKRIRAKRTSRASHLKTNYNMTLDQYTGMLKLQSGGCAICGKPPNNRKLAVDHDHACCPGEKTCGRCVRGLLCTTCNVWLGFYENQDWRMKADMYLKKYERLGGSS